jgi:hypothetical protein
LTFSLTMVVGILAIQYYVNGELAAAAQSPRTDTPEAALATLVSEIRGLRADLAASSQRTLRTQLLLGRLQMEEQRIAYLDKQRADATQRATDVQRAVAAMTAQAGNADPTSCNGKTVPREVCETQMKAMQNELKKQVAIIGAEDQQLRQQVTDAENALASEQARWADFNSQLDQLERSLR